MEQKGVIRVNCIDCLDRTNVTQVWRMVFSVVDYYLLVIYDWYVCHLIDIISAVVKDHVVYGFYGF